MILKVWRWIKKSWTSRSLGCRDDGMDGYWTVKGSSGWRYCNNLFWEFGWTGRDSWNVFSFFLSCFNFERYQLAKIKTVRRRKLGEKEEAWSKVWNIWPMESLESLSVQHVYIFFQKHLLFLSTKSTKKHQFIYIYIYILYILYIYINQTHPFLSTEQSLPDI